MAAARQQPEGTGRREPLYLRYADQLWPVTNRLGRAHPPPLLWRESRSMTD